MIFKDDSAVLGGITMKEGKTGGNIYRIHAPASILFQPADLTGFTHSSRLSNYKFHVTMHEIHIVELPNLGTD